MKEVSAMTISGKVLGEFGKGTKGSVSVNFGVSGGVHCDRSCAHHPQSTAPRPTLACYAVRTERRPDRSQLAKKLERHEGLPPALIVAGADIVSGRDIRKRRLEAARGMAKQRSAQTHRKTIVCPAVAASFLHRFEPERIAKCKCGKCQACARPHIDIVFPFH
jgi:hypothetical protein